MIKPHYTGPDRLKEKHPDLQSVACTQAIADLLVNPALVKNVNSFYNTDFVRKTLSEIYHYKCAYCESPPGPTSTIQVDHFRPKGGLKKIVSTMHVGYYWLAYEWTNLLPTCSTCNRAKSNSFPLAANSARVHHNDTPDPTLPQHRMIKSAVLANEQRLLLHPEIDDVEEAFLFKANGRIYPQKAFQAQAEKSIKIYKLQRDLLVQYRKSKIDKYWTELIFLLNDYEDSHAEGDPVTSVFLERDLKSYFRRMLNEQEPDQSYSRVGFYMFDHFEEFYIEELEKKGMDELADLVLQYYLKLILAA
jgi:uncharacterized protein (TIGR02646 family)